MPVPAFPDAPRWLLPLTGGSVALLAHLCFLRALDLQDLPGPGSALLVLDLVLGETSQGLSAWLGMPLAALLGPLLGVRVLMSLCTAAAIAGAALAATALGGPRAGALAAAWTGLGALGAHQGWLIDTGTVAWGLSWLGVGLAWQARPRPAALGAALLVLAVAAKPSALPLAPLALFSPFLLASDASAASRRALLLALAGGALLAVPLALLSQPPHTPWLAGELSSLSAPPSGWQEKLERTWGLSGQSAVLGGLLLLALLAGLLPPQRHRWLRLLVVLLTLLLALGVVAVRGDRLQPRHLLPLSLGLLAPAAVLAALPPPRLGAVLGLALALLAGADSLRWAQAWSGQREAHIDLAPARLPRLPAPRHHDPDDLDWSIFFESSVPGAVALMQLAAASPGPAVVAPLQDRREAHFAVAAALAGHPWAVLGSRRCCLSDEPLEGCAQRVAQALQDAGARVVFPNKILSIPQEEQAFVAAVQGRLLPRPPRRQTRWISVDAPAPRGEGGASSSSPDARDPAGLPCGRERPPGEADPPPAPRDR